MSAAGGISCAGCRHFNGRPQDIEAAMPGLASLSSAHAAVRSSDGLCAVHDRYLAATSICDAHAPSGWAMLSRHDACAPLFWIG